MSYLDGWTIKCPVCGYTDRGGKFDPSLSDECVCPMCCNGFLFEYPDDDEDDEDGE